MITVGNHAVLIKYILYMATPFEDASHSGGGSNASRRVSSSPLPVGLVIKKCRRMLLAINDYLTGFDAKRRVINAFSNEISRVASCEALRRECPRSLSSTRYKRDDSASRCLCNAQIGDSRHAVSTISGQLLGSLNALQVALAAAQMTLTH